MGRDYVLADMAGEHYWLGDAFVAVAHWADFAAEIPRFPCRAAAEAEARRLRLECDCYLRPVPYPRYGYRPTARPRRRCTLAALLSRITAN